MRVFQIGAVGTALAYLALSYSRTGTGYPQATMFLLAITTAALTVGLGAAVALHAWPEEIPGFGSRQLAAHDCHGCRQPMVEVRSAWMCPHCDRVG